jgi:RNA polymerase sigma factor (sigma-70 family)
VIDERLRPRLVAIAYRMVGSRTDADDLAQEALLRTHIASEDAERADDPIRSLEAYATTVVTRLSIDHLRSARVRRETYVGPWLPEPVVGEVRDDDAAQHAELADSLSFAFLVALESLGPVERAALLMHDVFGYDYDELATMLGRQPAACRQIVSRARTRVRERRPRFAVDDEQHRELLARFLDACRTGDLAAFTELLAEDVVVLSDGGAGVKAARFPILGRKRAARFLAKVMKGRFDAYKLHPTDVNGRPGFALVHPDGRVNAVGSVDTDGQHVTALHWVLNPEKLRRVRLG